ncbi:uncharacterized protein LOC127254247 isoform X2 [Andrographis paniculata]|uniref:uncharacterized protein LOC127254247 isoform X2 n=1 Tax=Andrographis paniculata TaxID=175694 RepID=UPI0021E99B18|nr:uncharacterized protein LOC127254247 isoform X2 [Andrographis paniculata]
MNEWQRDWIIGFLHLIYGFNGTITSSPSENQHIYQFRFTATSASINHTSFIYIHKKDRIKGMNFLAGRSAAKEGSYFLKESKQAVARVLQNTSGSPIQANNTGIPSADVLPEVLRHSLPSKIFHSPDDNSPSSFSKASKWALKSDPNRPPGSVASADAINPLTAYVSLPQVTFGPKRWQLPNSESSIVASTANDLRQDKHAPINPEKLKAAALGLSRIGSAFAIATAIVFGGVSLFFGLVASKLEMHNADDIRTKGKDFMQPKIETFKEQLGPLRTWAEDASQKWHMEKDKSLKEKPLIKELSRTLGVRTSSS